MRKTLDRARSALKVSLILNIVLVLYIIWKSGSSGAPGRAGPSAPGGAEAMRGAGVRLLNNRLMADVEVLELTPEGKLPIPAGIKRVVIEVGSNVRNTMDQEYLPYDPEAFAIILEPLMDKYAHLLNRIGVHHDIFAPLGFMHPRAVILPVAAQPGPPEAQQGQGFGSSADFTVSQVDGCSSLAKPDAEGMSALGWSGCEEVKQHRTVPTLPLHTIMSWFDLPIDNLKVDAQGLDLEVIMSAGEHLDRVRTVTAEVIRDQGPFFYEGQKSCSDMVRYMESRGFRMSVGAIKDGMPDAVCCYESDEDAFPFADMCKEGKREELCDKHRDIAKTDPVAACTDSYWIETDIHFIRKERSFETG
ncbi:unnamed protein product [Pedinophyceae sp. YPF-701]|nr:unnamed protein product [Pedinophyceae sp. YPF-701]